MVWLEVLGVLMALPMREVEDAAGDQRRSAVRPEVAEPHDYLAVGFVGSQFEPCGGKAEYHQVLTERPRCETERKPVLSALIGRVVDEPAVANQLSRIDADGVVARNAQ